MNTEKSRVHVFDVDRVVKQLCQPTPVTRTTYEFDLVLKALDGMLPSQSGPHCASIIAGICRDTGMAYLPVGFTQVISMNFDRLWEAIRPALVGLFVHSVAEFFDFHIRMDMDENVLCGELKPRKEIRADSLFLWLALVANPFLERGGGPIKVPIREYLPIDMQDGIGTIVPMLREDVPDKAGSIGIGVSLYRQMRDRNPFILPKDQTPFVGPIEKIVFVPNFSHRW